jgi:hypothetical protein
MRTYEGKRTDAGCEVTVDAKPLPLCLDIRNHSPTGFEWGYAGSGPAQLALALLMAHLGNEARALELYQRFKFHVVAGLPREGAWRLTSEDIDAALEWIEGTTSRR